MTPPPPVGMTNVYDADQSWSATTLHPEKGACEVVLASFNAG